MVWIVKALWWIVSSLFRSREQLEAENLALRHQVNLLRRSAPRRVLRAYANYYNRSRTHLSLDKDTPLSRPILQDGGIRSIPHMGGLQHSFARM